MRLPNGEQAILDVGKLRKYALSPAHARGRHKARVFRQVLGLETTDAEWLRETLLRGAATGDAIKFSENPWGVLWRLDVTVQRHDKIAVVRTIWIVRTGESVPRLVTCWIPR
jgi:hypothetical protein